MTATTSGIHHITAIASDPQRNLDFYAGTLGLRLVKRTVNFDDPGSYHFYFGDRTGRPGTLLTFISWPGAHRGRPGAGEAVVTSFQVPAGSLQFWEDRLGAAGVWGVERRSRFGVEVLRFADPDGMVVELVPNGARGEVLPAPGGVPGGAAIRRVSGATLRLADDGPTAALLAEVLGLHPAGGDQAVQRFAPDGDPSAGTIDLLRDPEGRAGSMGAGTVHHLAWRARDDNHQQELRAALLAAGHAVTPSVDRNYFRSVYFREPGGVLFELATDGPGFMVDEAEDALGQSLKLPARYEPSRRAIEAILPAIALPEPSTASAA
jgi:glyoxalase family protein